MEVVSYVCCDKDYSNKYLLKQHKKSKKHQRFEKVISFINQCLTKTGVPEDVITLADMFEAYKNSEHYDEGNYKILLHREISKYLEPSKPYHFLNGNKLNNVWIGYQLNSK